MTLPLKGRAASFKRLLDGAHFTEGSSAPRAVGRPRPPLDSDVASEQPPSRKTMRGAARPWHGLGVVRRGDPRLVREHPSSAPRAITEKSEFTKECLWSGSAPPNGSRLSCGLRRPRADSFKRWLGGGHPTQLPRPAPPVGLTGPTVTRAAPPY